MNADATPWQPSEWPQPADGLTVSQLANPLSPYLPHRFRMDRMNADRATVRAQSDVLPGALTQATPTVRQHNPYNATTATICYSLPSEGSGRAYRSPQLALGYLPTYEQSVKVSSLTWGDRYGHSGKTAHYEPSSANSVAWAGSGSFVNRTSDASEASLDDAGTFVDAPRHVSSTAANAEDGHRDTYIGPGDDASHVCGVRHLTMEMLAAMVPPSANRAAPLGARTAASIEGREPHPSLTVTTTGIGDVPPQEHRHYVPLPRSKLLHSVHAAQNSACGGMAEKLVAVAGDSASRSGDCALSSASMQQAGPLTWLRAAAMPALGRSQTASASPVTEASAEPERVAVGGGSTGLEHALRARSSSAKVLQQHESHRGAAKNAQAKSAVQAAHCSAAKVPKRATESMGKVPKPKREDGWIIVKGKGTSPAHSVPSPIPRSVRSAAKKQVPSQTASKRVSANSAKPCTSEKDNPLGLMQELSQNLHSEETLIADEEYTGAHRHRMLCDKAADGMTSTSSSDDTISPSQYNTLHSLDVDVVCSQVPAPAPASGSRDVVMPPVPKSVPQVVGKKASRVPQNAVQPHPGSHEGSDDDDGWVDHGSSARLSRRQRARESGNAIRPDDEDELLLAYAVAGLRNGAAPQPRTTPGSPNPVSESVCSGKGGQVTAKPNCLAAGRNGPMKLMGIAVEGISNEKQLHPSKFQSPQCDAAMKALQRAVTLSDSSSLKPLVLQKALAALPKSVTKQAPGLICALLLESSECSLDVEKCLCSSYTALKLATEAEMPVLEMLARLAITRTLARVIDTSDSRLHLTHAMKIAVEEHETVAAGWIAMQIGVTLELSGIFPDCFDWYALGVRLAEETGDNRLLCDALCCQSIAYCAVGEHELAMSAHARASNVMGLLPRATRQRVLQNLVQFMFQRGDVEAALALQLEELSIIRELADVKLVPHCVGSIALTRRFLGEYESAVEAYMDELGGCGGNDLRHTVECFLGASTCHRLSGHVAKAYDVGMRALRSAHQLGDATATAKALVEVAEAELLLGRVADAERNLQEALRLIQTVDEMEQKQYLVKAALCEIDWRCCNALERVHFTNGDEAQALRHADRCCVPNTFELSLCATRLRGGISASSRVVPPSTTSDSNLLDLCVLEEVLRSPMFANRKLVCYSLPWSDGRAFMAYVVSVDDCRLCVKAHRLALTDAALLLFLWDETALARAFDAPMHCASGRKVYGETPLWPQHYSKEAFDLRSATSTDHSGVVQGVRDSLEFCLKSLYDCFIRPLEEDLFTVHDELATRGVVFVGDGVVARVPFAALHCGSCYLAERAAVSTVPSLSMLLALYRAAPEAVRSGKPVKAVQVVGAASNEAQREWLAGLEDSKRVPEDALGRSLHRAEVTVTNLARECDDSPPALAEAPEKGTAVLVPQSTEPPAPARAALQAADALVASLSDRVRDTALSNALFFAVHRKCSGDDPAPTALLLHLAALPEMREDFCGCFTATASGRVAAHAADVARAWDLRRNSLVVSTGCGTYGSNSVHETGVPLYRALQYAGAARLLLPIGTRIPCIDREARRAGGVLDVVAAALSAVIAGCSVSEAVRNEQVNLIRSGAPVTVWAMWGLVGLP